MKTARIAMIVVLAALAHGIVYATPADELRELDRLRQQGLITEEAYEKRWNEIIAEGIRPRPTPQIRNSEVRDRSEISFSGSWLGLSAGDADLELVTAQISGGFMVTPHVQLTTGVLFLQAEIEDIDLTAFGGSFGVNYVFAPDRAITPYVGAGISYVFADLDGEVDDDDWAWEVRGGFKQHVRENVAIKYQISYHQFDQLDLDGITASIGLVFTF